MKTWKVVAACVLAVVAGSGCSDDSGTDSQDPQPTVAYLHTGCASWAAEFEALFEANDFPTTAIDLSHTPQPNLRGYSLIMLDARTAWRWPEDRDLIAQSGRPVLAMGEAGAIMLDSLGLSIGIGNCHVSVDTSSTAVPDTRLFLPNPSDDLFTIPIPFHVPPDSIIQVCHHAACVAAYEAGFADSAFGVATVPNARTEFPLAAEGSRWALWGFSSAPGAMTVTGHDLLINVVDALTSTN